MADLLKNPTDLLLLSRYVADACGIKLGEEKGYLFQSRLGSIVAQSGAEDIPSFIRLAKADLTGKLRDRIIDAMTTHETYWFRDDRVWGAVENHLLPTLAQRVKASNRGRIRILCAACSTGQEPYSVALLIDSLAKQNKLSGFTPASFEIVATDVSAGTLMLASHGRYNQIEIVRGLAEKWRSAYFAPTIGNTWTINEMIRRRITFKRHNLQDDMRTLGMFDLVLCRNVAIYFDEEFKKDLFRRIGQIIQPSGHLMLGATESLLTNTDIYERDMLGSSIFYRRK